MTLAIHHALRTSERAIQFIGRFQTASRRNYPVAFGLPPWLSISYNSGVSKLEPLPTNYRNGCEHLPPFAAHPLNLAILRDTAFHTTLLSIRHCFP